MNPNLKYAFLMMLGVFISCCTQLWLKKAAVKSYPKWWRAYLNHSVITAYLVFFGVTIIQLFVLRYIPLSYVPVIESFSYIFIPLLGYFVLHESISRKQGMGMVLIIVGAVVFAL